MSFAKITSIYEDIKYIDILYFVVIYIEWYLFVEEIVLKRSYLCYVNFSNTNLF